MRLVERAPHWQRQTQSEVIFSIPLLSQTTMRTTMLPSSACIAVGSIQLKPALQGALNGLKLYGLLLIRASRSVCQQCSCLGTPPAVGWVGTPHVAPKAASLSPSAADILHPSHLTPHSSPLNPLPASLMPPPYTLPQPPTASLPSAHLGVEVQHGGEHRVTVEQVPAEKHHQREHDS